MAQIKLYKTYKELQDIQIKELEEKYLYTKWVQVFMGRNMPDHTIKEILRIPRGYERNVPNYQELYEKTTNIV